MANCEMCGKDTTLYRTLVEETELSLCDACSKFGKVFGKARPLVDDKPGKPVSRARPVTETVEGVVPDFADQVRKKRQQLGMKQDEFGKLISERESVVHKIETGEFEPTLETARKLEKILKIKLVDTFKEETVNLGKASSEEFTLGDAVKVRKR